MSDYSVIADVGGTLKALLWDNIRVDDRIFPGIIGSENEITSSLPGETPGSDITKLALYLFRITENSFLKNRDMQNNDPLRLHQTPLGVDLFYLIIPGCENREMDHLLLGKVMQVFYDNSVVRGSALRGNALEGKDEQLRLYFYSLPFEEMLQLWQSFSEKSFKLAVCYQVSPVIIDSTLETEAKRVVQKEDRTHQKPMGEKENG